MLKSKVYTQKEKEEEEEQQKNDLLPFMQMNDISEP